MSTCRALRARWISNAFVNQTNQTSGHLRLSHSWHAYGSKLNSWQNNDSKVIMVKNGCIENIGMYGAGSGGMWQDYGSKMAKLWVK